MKEGGREGNALFNDTFNTFSLRLYAFGHMVKYYLAREETRCRNMGYIYMGSFIYTIL